MSKIGTSQNGWPVHDNTAEFVRTEVEGVAFISANRDVALVLDDFTQWYNDTIESITLPVREAPGRDDWSYAVRPIRGQTTGYSNHGSATARDLNATRHPRGVKGTHTSAERAALAKKIESYGGVLRHGEFYSGTVDGMHVEINAGPATVKRVADRIRAARQQQEDDMALSDKDVDRIAAAAADAVRKEVIPNKTPGSPDGVSTMGGSVVDIERTQDGHTKELRELKEGQAKILEQLGLLATAVGKLTPPAPKA